ncbi:2-oxoacid:ferredoxin oxidoreductase subunit beta [Methanosphaera sp. WGK6]|uniref:2-oxoacid:ferredoxin oxidoreductase subunit beta n=1 Tax=Methanosphaera sp. WGK6 TaxID=1561964 RepID=UPI00084C6A77|nr:2-oxoacid:ferredoxin oxidoreductase subunit beta [Methanosphaera sp. WGK6]OED30570.1 2-oxoglutarate synthase [Methanosphaera sp. WGK6]
MSIENKPSRFIKYLREERLPHIFCPGCGNGIVMNTFFNAIEQSGKSLDNLNMVSGIGCSSRIPGYVKCDSLHTTHGRAIAFATGLKIANPHRDVVVVTGDGDATSIGGNHLIHAARRNINLTVICINNDIYGMTGGQISPTSPEGSFATTAPYGSTDKPFNISEVVKAAGASYVAKYTTTQPIQVTNAIKEGLENKGFSFIEVVSQCPTYYGRKNKIKSPVAMLDWFKKNIVSIESAKEMSNEELQGKIVTGVYVNKPRKEFIESMETVIREHSEIDCDDNINNAYKVN